LSNNLDIVEFSFTIRVLEDNIALNDQIMYMMKFIIKNFINGIETMYCKKQYTFSSNSNKTNIFQYF